MHAKEGDDRSLAWVQCLRMGATAALSLGLQALAAGAQSNPNYPAPYSRPTWCSVPNYRYYRFTPTKVRGFIASTELHCGLGTGMPDGCFCLLPEECRSGYCIPDATGVPSCTYPVIQISEVEFWRAGRRVNTAKLPDNIHDAFRIMNGVDVAETWGVWELEFYHDTSCSNRAVGGTPIASSARLRGFGHSIDHTAPLGPHDTPRTYWQSTHELVEAFELHGPAAFAFDGDVRTNWWADCKTHCSAQTEWIGLSYSAPLLAGMKCFRILQDKDRDFSSFSLMVQGHRQGVGWETFATFNAATWDYGGVWEQLSVPQGVSFIASTGHARAMDGDLNSSVVDLVGAHLDFDFGVETEIDAWRWATAEEPLEVAVGEDEPFTCDHDGLCPRDPAQWTLEGSLDLLNWVTLQNQETDFPGTIYRKRFTPFQPVHHEVSLSIGDIWPDGRGKCAARR